MPCVSSRLGYIWAATWEHEAAMAATTIDPEYERHRQTWVGFTRLIKVSLAVIVITLLLLAFFLL